MLWTSVEKYAFWLLVMTAVTVCAVATGASFARWYFSDSMRMPVSSSSVTLPRESHTVMLNDRLFGQSSNAQQRLQPTQLKLTLAGVFPSQTPSLGMAAIGTSQGTESVFQVGETVLPEVTLAAVYDHYVVLERAGVEESLYFDRDGGESAPALFIAPSSSQISSQKTVPDTLKERFKTYQQRDFSQPETILDDIGVSRTEGRYQLNEGSPLMPFGFQSGDRIIAINGKSIDAIKPNADAIKSLRNSESLRIEVERNGLRFIMNVSPQ